MRNYDLKDKSIQLHNVLFATTSPSDYEMSRLILLEDMPDLNWNEYVLLEGYHCSCYGFDETRWDATVFTEEELNKLMEAEQYGDLRKELEEFWKKYRSRY